MTTRTGGLRWSLMFFLIAPITFVMSLDRTAMAVAAPTIQHEYAFSLVEMSVILTSFSWTYALFQVPGGWLADATARAAPCTGRTPCGRHLPPPPRSASAFSPLSDSALCWGWARPRTGQAPSSPSAAGSPIASAARATPSCSAPCISDRSPPPPSPPASSCFGWRGAFYIYGSLGIVLGAAWWTWFRDDPAEHPNITRG